MNFHTKSGSLTSAEPGEFIMKLLKQSLTLLVILSLVLATAPGGFAYQTDESTARAGSARAADSRTIATVGSTNRTLSGCFGCADPGGLDISH